GAAQPGARRQCWEQRVQCRGLLREHSVQGGVGQAFLLIQTRQDLLHQDARQVPELPLFHHALLCQLIQRQKLQQLLAGPWATTDAPESSLVLLAVGTPETLHKRCDAFRWLVQDDPIHVADVDAQLERAGSDAQRLSPTLKLALDLLALTRF